MNRQHFHLFYTPLYLANGTANITSLYTYLLVFFHTFSNHMVGKQAIDPAIILGWNLYTFNKSLHPFPLIALN